MFWSQKCETTAHNAISAHRSMCVAVQCMQQTVSENTLRYRAHRKRVQNCKCSLCCYFFLLVQRKLQQLLNKFVYSDRRSSYHLGSFGNHQTKNRKRERHSSLRSQVLTATLMLIIPFVSYLKRSKRHIN